MQNDFVHPRGKVGATGEDLSGAAAAVRETNRLLQAVRAAGGLVVYVVVEHGRAVDLPPYQARYAQRGMDAGDPLCSAGTWGAELYGELEPPVEGEPLLVKHGYDAFAVPELAQILRERGVQTVVVAGVVTNLCVAATSFSAFEHGFFVLVPRQTTAAVNGQAAAATLGTIADYYGDVIELDDLIRKLTAAAVSNVA
jgi:nicotinamidase-related amidase